MNQEQEMAAFTLKIAKDKLNEWLEAESRVAAAQSYKIGTRELTRADLPDIRKQIAFWAEKVESLEAAENLRGRRRVTRIVPRDL